jgi:hypothetical protein
MYERGDYVKVEFPDETTGIGEWMWVRVTDCDDEKKLVFGMLDNEPVNDYGGMGSSNSGIRECWVLELLTTARLFLSRFYSTETPYLRRGS